MDAFATEPQNIEMSVSTANAPDCALSLQYQHRGLSKAVVRDALVQIEAEQKTAEMMPNAYRLSGLSDAAVTGIYRGGKETMSSSDLIRYFNETRSMRTKNSDFSDAPSIYDVANPQNVTDEAVETALVVQESEPHLPRKLTQLPRMALKKLSASVPEWFDSGASKKNEEKKKFPLSAFAAIMAVAVSLMLIVASSVMLTRAESRINQLTVEAEVLTDEISELQSDVNVESNLLELREIAMDQYGMVDEKYVEMTYLDTESEESIEAYEEERDSSIGLSALLSALGIK